MNKLMMVVGAIVLAGMMAGCATGGVGEDKVAAWQKDRTPVEVLKSKIEVKAAGAVVEALDVAPFGIYKAIADKVDESAVMDRYRRIYLGYVGDVKALEGQGKSHAEAIKTVLDQVRAQPDGAETIAKLKEYLQVAQKTDFEAIAAWIQKMTEELQKASEKFANEAPNALQQLMDIAQKEGGMAIMKIPSQGKDDLGVIGAQLADSGKGLALYVEMVNADKEAAKIQADYPVEG
ncbi:MAG: hypothetical protein MJ240_00965 [Kiritimatiellae bacterium]|nr:hypothetical protein [Kiritimatiellia bacterium]